MAKVNAKLNAPKRRLELPAKAVKPQAKPAKVAAPAGAKVAAAVVPAVKAAKPRAPMHDIKTGYTGASRITTTNQSRTRVILEKFGKLLDAPMTFRDQEALEGLRREFAKKPFTRSNIDTGILRRLGERGYVRHVSGSDVDPGAVFELTQRAF
jgi:hypothetical protein